MGLAVVARLVAFLRSFSGFLLGHLYPGAPYPRKSAALMLLGLLLGSWAGPDKHMRPATIAAGKDGVAAAPGGGEELGAAPCRAGHDPGSAGARAAGHNLLEAARQAELAAGEPLFCPGFLERPLVDVLLSAPYPRNLLGLAFGRKFVSTGRGVKKGKVWGGRPCWVSRSGCNGGVRLNAFPLDYLESQKYAKVFRVPFGRKRQGGLQKGDWNGVLGVVHVPAVEPLTPSRDSDVQCPLYQRSRVEHMS